MENKDKIYLTVGLFILLSAIGTTYLVTQEEQANLYQCGDIVGMCFKLSAENDNGFQTRCYYNESAPRKYKNCKTGWSSVDFIIDDGELEIIGEPVILPDFEVKTFKTRVEAEDYIKDIKKDISYEVNIVKTEQKPYSTEMEVFWNIIILSSNSTIYTETLTSMISEDATDKEITDLVDLHANEFANTWFPNIKIIKE